MGNDRADAQLAADLNAALQSSARFQRTRERAALDEAVGAWERVIDGLVSQPEVPAWAILGHASSLLERHLATGVERDLEQAIAELDWLRSQLSRDAPLRAACLTSLGNALVARARRGGPAGDLEAAITAFEETAALSPAGSSAQADSQTNLGIARMTRYEQAGRPQDLTSAAAAFRTALDATPDPAPERGARLSNLGHAMRMLHLRTGNTGHLDEAIAMLETAARISEGSGDVAPLVNLGGALLDRHAITGRPEHLDAAVTALEAALAATPLHAPERASRLNSVGVALYDRYLRTGRAADLDAAIGALEDAIALTPDAAPERARHMQGLGAGLMARHERTGDLAELDAAIAALQAAVDATRPSSPELHRRLNSLAIGHRRRYLRFGAADDLQIALQIQEAIVATTPETAPERAGYLNNLGTMQLDHYARTARPADLDAAIGTLDAAVMITPQGSAERARNLNNLGAALIARYRQTHQPGDLDRGIRACEAAVAAASGSPDLINGLANLADAASLHHELTGDSASEQTARSSFRRSCELGGDEAPAIAIHASRAWGNWATARRAWAEAAEAFGCGLAVFDRLYQAQAIGRHRSSWQRAAAQLSVGAAYALARDHRAEQAATVLERGRARRLGESLARGQAELDELRSAHPDLVDRYLDAATTVAMIESDERALSAPGAAGRPPTAGEASAVWRALEAAVDAIRAMPGHERFLRPPTFGEVAEAAGDAPIVYLAVSPVGGVALIVHRAGEHPAPTVSTVWLDDVTDADISAALSGPPGERVADPSLRDRLPQLLALLGDRVMGPVAAHLRAAGASSVVLVPSGRLGLLPLHAARYTFDGRARNLFDELDVGYAPSAQVFAAARRALVHRGSEPPFLVGVGNPLPNPVPLPYAQAELEEVAALYAETSRTALYGPQATRRELLAALPAATHVHFACHGAFDPEHPLQSRLVLSGDALTLLDVLNQDRTAFAKARLVVLSACQSSIPEYRELPDEVLSFPSGFLEAEVPGSIGTLWAVDDLSTALLIVKFYELHLHGDVATGERSMLPARALCRAQRWLRDATAGELANHLQHCERLGAAVRDVSLPHAASAATVAVTADRLRSMNPDERPYAGQPYCWAPFVFTGA